MEYIHLFEKYISRNTSNEISDNTGRIFEILKRDCSNFLNDLKRCYINFDPKFDPIDQIKSNKFFYRGIRTDYEESIIRKKSRKNRKPKDIDISVSNQIDEIFYDEYGIRPRSSGIFTNPNAYAADSYGNLYLVFPIGKYKYIWSESIIDLYDHLKDDQYFTFDEYDFEHYYSEIKYSWYYYFTSDRLKKNYIKKLAFDMFLSDNVDISEKGVSMDIRNSSNFKKYLKEAEEELDETMNMTRDDFMKHIVNEYSIGSGSNLCDALNHDSEVVFLTDEYYLVEVGKISERKLLSLIKDL